MPVAALRIDPDDLAFDLLPEIERSFGVELPRDLRHIETVGDLHALVLTHAPGVDGAACGTVLAFRLLRRALARHGLDPRAGPDQALSETGLPSPRAMREQLAETGLIFPARVAGGWCAIALLLAVAVLLLAWASGDVFVAAAMPGLCCAAAALDEGRWSGEWATLGSLARATAALNHRALADRGARHSPASVWNSLRTLLAGYGVGSRDIGFATRLMG